jgi:hypothetical protein
MPQIRDARAEHPLIDEHFFSAVTLWDQIAVLLNVLAERIVDFYSNKDIGQAATEVTNTLFIKLKAYGSTGQCPLYEGGRFLGVALILNNVGVGLGLLGRVGAKKAYALRGTVRLFASDGVKGVAVDEASDSRVSRCTLVVRIGLVADVLAPFCIKQVDTILKRRTR